MALTALTTDWRSRGACLTADPDLFFPISSVGLAAGQVSHAKAICGSCPVQPQCLSFALETNQAHGVWGGTSAEDRVTIRRQAHAA
ncbi:MAG TPA: WhiB family transcriptional regulator [Streptosporangiaceae bacterium]|jgi:WhiB family redox-sensing transcriptional regulator